MILRNHMKKPNLVWSIIILVVFVALLVIGGIWAKKQPKSAVVDQQAAAQAELDKLTSPVKQIMKEGVGEGAVAGDSITVNYVGLLPNGTVFDTSVQEVAEQSGIAQEGRTYEPFTFTLGSTDVISGWNVAVTDMKKGEVAQFALPASFAYGEQGVGNIIPPNSPLIFQIEVIDIVKPSAQE